MNLKFTWILAGFLIIVLGCEPAEEKAEDVILKSIAFHDPSGQWKTFSDTLDIVLTTPDQPERLSEVIMDFPGDYFSLNSARDSITKTFIIDKNECVVKLNGSSEISSAEAKNNNLSCDMAQMYKNYYEYLYGLPMKLQDKGANIESLEKVTFLDKEYFKVHVTYDKKVGSDIWNFYFNPETYALEAYQFFKSDSTSGDKIPGSGEYILLDGLKEIRGIKMPKSRKWFYNSNDKILGTDILQ